MTPAALKSRGLVFYCCGIWGVILPLLSQICATVRGKRLPLRGRLYFLIALIIIYITCLLHKILKNWWRNRTRDRILENLEDRYNKKYVSSDNIYVVNIYNIAKIKGRRSRKNGRKGDIRNKTIQKWNKL